MPLTKVLIETSSDLRTAFESWLCTTDFKTYEDARNAGIALGTEVYGVPLAATGTYSSSQRETWKHSHCQSESSALQYSQRYKSVMQLVPPEAYAAWQDCQRSHAFGLVCWFDRPSAEDWQKLVLRTKWTPLPGDTGKPPQVQSASTNGAHLVGSTNTMPFAKGELLTAGPSANLVREREGASVAAVINSNRQSCSAFAEPHPAVFQTVYEANDPATGVPFKSEQTFVVSGPAQGYFTFKPRGDHGSEFVISTAEAGAVITSIDECAVAPGGGGGWTHIELCTNKDSGVRIEGWTNSGESATIKLTYRFKRARIQCKEYCGDARRKFTLMN